tara:strand:+ start:36 stop:233 length:198 start_codon:yes stop_codon:yes gene_type:complete
MKFKAGDLIQSETRGIGLIERLDKDGWYWINFFNDPFCMEGNRRGYAIYHASVWLTKAEDRGHEI